MWRRPPAASSDFDGRQAAEWEGGMTDLLRILKGVRKSGDGWTALCPAHEDKNNSLSFHHRDGRWLLKCHAGCSQQEVIEALAIKPGDLFDDQRREGGVYPPKQ